MNKLWGNFLFGLARIVDFVFGHLANGAALCAGVLYNFRQGCAPFLFLLVLLALGMPFYGMILFLSLGRWLIPILLILLLPFVFAKLTVVLHRFHYICSEYLYDRADYHRLGVDHRKTWAVYRQRYEQETIRKEEERRRKEQERVAQMWEEIFRQFNASSGQTYYWDATRGGYQNGQTGGSAVGGRDPRHTFVEQYERSCQILGISPSADAETIKRAYRKKAKELHPDHNHSAEATRMFQEVGEAYTFLSEENQRRYQQLKRSNG